MHEVSIAEALISEVAAAAARHGLARVDAVGIRVGCRSGVTAEALVQAFDVLRRGPLLERAAITVEETEGADLRLAWIEGE